MIAREDTQAPPIPFFPVSDRLRARTIREEKLRQAREVLQLRERAAYAARDARERDRLHHRLDALWGRYVALEDERDAAFWLRVEHVDAGSLLEGDLASAAPAPPVWS